MHKENNTKIKNIKKYKKIHSLLNVLNSTRQKNCSLCHITLVFVANINICKYRAN
jgi:hypothetical protein